MSSRLVLILVRVSENRAGKMGVHCPWSMMKNVKETRFKPRIYQDLGLDVRNLYGSIT